VSRTRTNFVATLISPLKTETLYNVLQIETTATRSEIKRSYIALAKESHPDALLQNVIVDDPEADRRFNEIARAYKILSDPTK
jgi:molecular chaperone DnaJ